MIGIEHPYAASVRGIFRRSQFHFNKDRVLDLPGVETFEEGARLSMELMADDLSL